jgi:hypothetical protein
MKRHRKAGDSPERRLWNHPEARTKTRAATRRDATNKGFSDNIERVK